MPRYSHGQASIHSISAISTQFPSHPPSAPQQKSSGSTSHTQASHTGSSHSGWACSLQQLLGSGVSVGRTVKVGATVFCGVDVETGTGVNVGRSGGGRVATTPTVMLPSEPQPLRSATARPKHPTKARFRSKLAERHAASRIIDPKFQVRLPLSLLRAQPVSQRKARSGWDLIGTRRARRRRP
jgi:hypothetical protein